MNEEETGRAWRYRRRRGAQPVGEGVMTLDGGSIGHAHQVWDNAPAELRHPGDYDAPRGAVVIWDGSIGGGAGHIAISLGDGRMVTTTRGAVDIRPIRGFASSAYLGWMPPYFTST